MSPREPRSSGIGGRLLRSLIGIAVAILALAAIYSFAVVTEIVVIAVVAIVAILAVGGFFLGLLGG